MESEYYNKKYSRYSVDINKDDSLKIHSITNFYNAKSNFLPTKQLITSNDRIITNSEDITLKKSLTNSNEINNNLVQKSEFSKHQSIPLGLVNQTHYCYMNSVVQSLRNCHEFVNNVLSLRLEFNKLKLKSNENDINLVSAFLDLIYDLAYRNRESIENSSLKFQKYHEKYPDFATGEQDADEYLQFLLNKLNDVTKSIKDLENKKTKQFFSFKSSKDSNEILKKFFHENNSFTAKLFCGQMNNELSCNNCKFKKPFFQVFWVLSVPINIENSIENEYSLENCIKAMENPQEVSFHKCPSCKQMNSMNLTTHITNWPKYLILYLKRSLQIGLDIKTNIRINWLLEDHLVISKDQHLYRYSLLGVIDHIGSIKYGHYVAKFRDLNDFRQWWCYDDTNVSQINLPETNVITGNTTTYFFQR